MEIIFALSALLAISLAARFVGRMASDGIRLRSASKAPRKAFAAKLSAADHWSRATGIVELSLARAGSVMSHNAAIARQLEAADYALHNLLGELTQVMAVSVASPLARQAQTAAASAPMRRALAA